MKGKMYKISCPHCWNRLFEGAYIGVCCLRCSKCKSAWKVEVGGERIKMTPQNCPEPEDARPE